MALRKQIVDIVFDKGADTVTDSKLVIPSKFLRVENLEIDRFTTLRQRPGYTAKTLTAATGSAAVANIHQLHVLGAELLLEATSGLHAFSQQNTVNRDLFDGSNQIKTLERGQIDYVDVTSGPKNQFSMDAATASPSGVECWAWNEVDESGRAIICYRVVDGATRTVLQEGLVAGTPAAINDLQAFDPRVLVRDVAGASRFYIYYSTLYNSGFALTRSLAMKSIDIANGAKITGALSAESIISATAPRGFDGWYDPTSDKVVLAYRTTAVAGFTLAIINGSDGTTVTGTSNKVAEFTSIAVLVTYNGGTGYALAVYNDATTAAVSYGSQTVAFTIGQVLTGGTSGATGTIATNANAGTHGVLRLGSVSGLFVPESITDAAGGAAQAVDTRGASSLGVAYPGGGIAYGVITAYSTLLTGATALTTTLTSDVALSGGLSRSGRLTLTAYQGAVQVFFDTLYLDGVNDQFFPDDIGFVGCLYNGSAPYSQSVFARGVVLAARPATYSNANVVSVCVTAALMSTVQPTIFLLAVGSVLRALVGFGTIALGTHSPPRVLARLLPGECANISTVRTSTTRLASPMAVVA